MRERRLGRETGLSLLVLPSWRRGRGHSGRRRPSGCHGRAAHEGSGPAAQPSRREADTRRCRSARSRARMKLASSVHFVTGLFLAIAPDAKRMRKETERCDILGVSHATEVQRFEMHPPERLKSDRTTVRAHAIAIAPRPLGPVGLLLLRCRCGLFWRNCCKSSAGLRGSSVHAPGTHRAQRSDIFCDD